MRVLALIPARKGSKRLPGKNKRFLGEKPLIVWTIDVAKQISVICDVLVSTDDPDIATMCSQAGAYVPWLRPADLATDFASSADVALHALNWYEGERGPVDGVLLLQPTSPFRTTETVRKGIELFRKNNRQAVVGVSIPKVHPMWTLKIEGDHLAPFMQNNGLGLRSQDLAEVYVVNGSFYLISPDDLRTERSFFTSKAAALIISSPAEALDIDTMWDWKMAEIICQSLSENL